MNPILTGGLLAMATITAPPATRTEPVENDYHGVNIVDDYRWLEGNAAPEKAKAKDPKLDEEVARWTDLQNEHARKTLDAIPGRKKLAARIRELMEVGSISTPSMSLDRYFYLKREGSQAQATINMREGFDAEEEVLVDPNEIDKTGLTTVSWIAPNHDGSLLAFGIFRAGDENSTLYLMNIDSGEWLADVIPGKVSSVDWLPDSSGFFYRNLADVENAYSGQVCFHSLGVHHRHDEVLFEQYKEGPLATTWGPFASASRDGRWMLLGYYTGTDSNDLWAVDLDRWSRNGEFLKSDIIVGAKARSSGAILGDTLYLHTTFEAPNGRVVAVDLNNSDRKNWKVFIPERKDAVIESVALARGIVVATYLKNASNTIERFKLDGSPVGELDLPGIGSASLATSDDRTEAYLAFESFNEPKSIYRVDLKTGRRALWARPPVPVDPSTVEVSQVQYKSKDGTAIPMFIVKPKGMQPSGAAPTLLTGYGGFGISRTPAFSATLFPWFEAGGVYALPNLRGGGEFGEAWHQAGMLDKKQNVFDDFIAAAEWLIDNKHTNPTRLAIVGGSNGGLLTGAAITQRPELFAAAISAVPLLDMLRYQHFLMAKYWVPEYGSAEDPTQFRFLSDYSPYQKVKKGTAYPAVFLTAGEHDTRVHALHARKMAALMQAATASDQAKKPILLWVDRSAGHGRGKPLDLLIRDVVDQRCFLMWQLGMLADEK